MVLVRYLLKKEQTAVSINLSQAKEEVCQQTIKITTQTSAKLNRWNEALRINVNSEYFASHKNKGCFWKTSKFKF